MGVFDTIAVLAHAVAELATHIIEWLEKWWP